MEMPLNYEQAKRLEGKMIEFRNKQGEWAIGRVVKVKKDGLMIEELKQTGSDDGYGYGLWGGPFWGPPAFFGFAGVGVAAPFFFW
jgi:hypothetical protein